MLGILDLGFGNIASLASALKHIGCDFTVLLDTSPSREIHSCSHFILPGVGSFAFGSTKIKSSPVFAQVFKRVHNGAPFLGICLGMQLLFDSSTEDGFNTGLGVMPGNCLSFDSIPHFTYPIPHVGYACVSSPQFSNSLFVNIDESNPFYFVHSYRILVSDLPLHNVGTTTYGTSTFISYINVDNIYGVQFHPEKSQLAGLQLLKNFSDLR